MSCVQMVLARKSRFFERDGQKVLSVTWQLTSGALLKPHRSRYGTDLQTYHTEQNHFCLNMCVSLFVSLSAVSLAFGHVGA